LRILLEKNVNLLHWDRIGDTALIKAVRNGHMEIVKMIVQKENMTIFDTSKNSENTIMIAQKNGHRAIERYLVKQCPPIWRLWSRAARVWLFDLPASFIAVLVAYLFPFEKSKPVLILLLYFWFKIYIWQSL
jgi:hypothetical protein